MKMTITPRTIVRVLVAALMGMQIGLMIVFLLAGQYSKMATPFAMTAYMGLTLYFEAKSHRLQEQNKNLQEFLDFGMIEEEEEENGRRGEMD